MEFFSSFDKFYFERKFQSCSFCNNLHFRVWNIKMNEGGFKRNFNFDCLTLKKKKFGKFTERKMKVRILVVENYSGVTNLNFFAISFIFKFCSFKNPSNLFPSKKS